MTESKLKNKLKMGREERNRIGLFVLLVALIVALSGLVGFVVIDSSNSAKTEITKQGLLYEQQKNPDTKSTDNQQQTQSTVEGEAQLATPDNRVVTGSVLVYYSKYPESQSQNSELKSVERLVYQGQDPYVIAVEELISGPSSAEKAEGYYGGVKLTGDSNCDSKDYKITQTQDTVIVQFCRQLDKDFDSKAQSSQFIQTLKVLSGQDKVNVLDSNGKCIFGSLNEGCTQ